MKRFVVTVLTVISLVMFVTSTTQAQTPVLKKAIAEMQEKENNPVFEQKTIKSRYGKFIVYRQDKGKTPTYWIWILPKKSAEIMVMGEKRLLVKGDVFHIAFFGASQMLIVEGKGKPLTITR